MSGKLVRILLLRAASPVRIFETPFQRRCVQQALFMMLRDDSFANVAVEVGMALEQMAPDVSCEHFPVLLGAITDRHRTPAALLNNPTTRAPLLHAILQRGSAIAKENPTNMVHVGNVLHFFHSRQVAVRHWYLLNPLRESMAQNSTVAIPAATWLAYYNALAYSAVGLDANGRALHARFIDQDAARCFAELTCPQLQSMLYALSVLHLRLTRGADLVRLSLCALAPHIPSMSSRQLVACLFSAHKAHQYEERFFEPCLVVICEELSSLTDWDLGQLAVLVDAGVSSISVATRDVFWTAFVAELNNRKDSCAISPFVAGTHRVALALSLLPDLRPALQQAAEVLLQRYGEQPHTKWNTRELRQLERIVSDLSMARSGAVARFCKAAEAVLPKQRFAEWTVIRSLGSAVA